MKKLMVALVLVAMPIASMALEINSSARNVSVMAQDVSVDVQCQITNYGTHDCNTFPAQNEITSHFDNVLKVVPADEYSRSVWRFKRVPDGNLNPKVNLTVYFF
jgi:hypothetical protein